MSIRERFETDGFVFPLDGMKETEAHDYRTVLEETESTYGKDPNFIYATNDGLNVVLPMADEITRRAEILDRVEELLGPDLIVFSTSLFAKPPRSAHYISWHQDLTYWGLSGTEEVTVWLALSPATTKSGCMRMLRGSHLRELVAHEDSFDAHNLLSRGQTIAQVIDETTAVDIELRPGQFSMHHGHTFHGSHPNRSDDRRIGISINYITPRMRNRAGLKPMARLVRGDDRYGNFQLISGPHGTLDPRDIELLKQSKEIAQAFYYAGTDKRLETDAIGIAAQK